MCKLSWCKQASKGICKICETGYRVDGNGSCAENDKVCDKYSDTTGKCLKCSVGFFVNKDGKCEAKKPGCVYQGYNCTNCSQPFSLNNGQCEIFGCKLTGETGCLQCKEPFVVDLKTNSCVIEGCSTYDTDGCKKCETPYLLNDTDKTCKIEKCLKSANQICEACEMNYIIQNGKCFKEDPYCDQYSNDTGKCSACKTNYTVSVEGDRCTRKVKTYSDNTKANGTTIDYEDDENNSSKKNKTEPPKQTNITNETTPTSNITTSPIPNTTTPTNTTTAPNSTIPIEQNISTSVQPNITTPVDKNQSIKPIVSKPLNKT